MWPGRFGGLSRPGLVDGHHAELVRVALGQVGHAALRLVAGDHHGVLPLWTAGDGGKRSAQGDRSEAVGYTRIKAVEPQVKSAYAWQKYFDSECKSSRLASVRKSFFF